MAGDRVGAWALEGHIASGGMDDVYDARHVASGERAALKVPRASDPVSTARFERGARIAASMVHPRIVRVLGHGRDGDAAWLALERLRGEDLARRLSRGRMSVGDAIDVAAQVCDALSYAHARRVVHRDLTPGNIYLREGDAVDVRVLDLGVARVKGERTVTATDQLVGTLAYMSPEQLRGERDLDARADLWSLGVVLFECLTGRRRPFDAETAYATLFQVVHAPTPDPRALRPELPAALCDILHRALQKDRDARFASAAAFADALAAVPRDAPTDVAVAPAGADAAWLVSVVCLLDVRDAPSLSRRAASLGATVAPLPRDGALLASFGRAQWVGDEAHRAVSFAREALLFARAAGVATGRDDGHGAVAAAAAARARAVPRGISLDDATSTLVRAASLPEAPAEAPFVGRRVELDLLLDAVETSRAQGVPQAVLVLGTPGQGRSRLAAQARALLAARAPEVSVLSHRCDVGRRDAPLAALHAMLGAGDLATAGPALDPQVPLDRARAALTEAIAGHAARGGSVVVVDDAQWLDTASREVLRQVFEAAAAPFALWLLASPDARAALLTVAPEASVRALGPLARDDARAMLAHLAPTLDDVAAARLVDRAEGQPLFLEELARLRADGDDALPATIEAAFQARLHAMSDDAREFCRCAAVYGRVAWVEGAASLGADPRALPGLQRAGQLVAHATSRVEGASEFAFRSGLLREVAYALWPDGHRAACHARAAAWLADRRGVGPEELARHWDLAGDAPRAGAYYALAAEASARVAGVTALAHAEAALARSDDLRVRWRAALARDTALQIDGDRARHAESVEALAALAPSLGVGEMAEAAWRRCYLARVTGRLDDARRDAEQAIDLADGADAAAVAVQARVELALMEANVGAWSQARALADAACEQARRAGDPWLTARAETTLAYVLGEVGDAAAATVIFDRAAAAYARAGDARREAIALANSGATQLRVGRLDEALERLDAAVTLSRRVGNVSTIAVASQNLAPLHRALGDLARSRAALDEADRIAPRLRRPRLDAAIAIERAYLALAESSPDRAAVASRAVDLARPTRSPNLLASALAAAVRASPEAAWVAEARALADTLDAMPECEAELRAALWCVDGDDGARASAALERFVRSMGDLDDPEACREGFARRYLLSRVIGGAAVGDAARPVMTFVASSETARGS